MTDNDLAPEVISRRAFLKCCAASGSTIMLGSIVGTATAFVARAATAREQAVRIIAPTEATVLPGFLAAKLQWEYAEGEAPDGVVLSVATQHDPRHPVVRATLDGAETTYALPLVPNETYVWRLQPTDAHGRRTVTAAQGTFTTGPIRLVDDAPDTEMYKNPRANVRYAPFTPMPFGEAEPLSPWYGVKRYTMAPPPKFADVKDRLPQPIFDGHPDALETYWYCWQTLLEVWYYAPTRPDHQAVANINGSPDWAGWGSSQVWDSFCMMHFARFGHQAYPFITQYDNAYARQHENGFICQESDNNNFEVYACHPALCPFLIGWTEWNYYKVSGDVERLRRVFIPLVKNYEWFMTYMRHSPDGIYGFVTPRARDACGTDSFDLPFQATCYRAAETLAMARIAELVGRPDMAKFFNAEYRRLGDYINEHYWDAEHQLYNDLCDPNYLSDWAKYRDPKLAGKFVTEAIPGDINKSVGTFLPLFAEFAPPERVPVLERLLRDPKKGFEWPMGISYSLDTTSLSIGDDTGEATATTSKIWPPPQYLVQQGFKQYGKWSVAQEVAERYFNGVVVAYMKSKMIREALDATQPIFDGHKDFVGWGGLAPIGNFIEYILGFDVDVPHKTIAWHVRRTERHGLQHLKIGDFYVDLLCDERSAINAPCRLTVRSGGAFTLETIVNGTTVSHKIGKGAVTLKVG